MKLIRHFDLPQNVQDIHHGPIPGGTFWANRNCHDLPEENLAEGELIHFLRNGRVWIQDAQNPDSGWQEITKENLSNLPRFRKEIDNNRSWESCSIVFSFSPYLPEFYFLPTNWRGKRILRRAENKAFNKEEV